MERHDTYHCSLLYITRPMRAPYEPRPTVAMNREGPGRPARPPLSVYTG